MKSNGGGDTNSRAACLMGLRRLEVATVSEVAKAAGMSRPTTETSLVKLAAMGLVDHRVDQVLPHEAGGRPARVSRFCADAGYVVGLDLIGTTVASVLSDLSGRWVQVGSHRPRTPTSERPGLEPLHEAVEALVDEAGVERSRVRAVGLGTAGVARADGSMLSSPFIEPFTEGNLARRISELLQAPVVVDNDLTLAAVAEARMGALRDQAVAVYAETGHNMAVRTLIDGTVLRGRNRIAGEVGLHKHYRDTRYTKETYFDDLERIDAALGRIAAGVGTTQDAVERSGLVAGMAGPLSSLTLVTDPDVIALGGTLGRHADILVPELIPAIQELLRSATELPRIVGSELVDEGVLVGAVDQAFERFPEQVYGLPGIEPPVQTPAAIIRPSAHV